MSARSKRTRMSVVGLALVTALTVPGSPAVGTASDAEITDPAGDGNFVNGQGQVPGHETGPDTRPASFDNVDLRAVWFETAYTTTKVLDPASGAVLRVEHRPTALLVHVQTQGPARPMSPFTTINYRVSTTLPGCKASFELDVFTSPPALTPERANIRPLEGTQCDPDGGLALSPVAPTFEGAVSTMTFPFVHDYCQDWRCSGLVPHISKYISEGTAIGQPAALADGSLPGIGSPFLLADETVTGRDFTIGQDVPRDVECSDEPAYPGCGE